MDFIAARYSTQPWPAYQFRPGQNPHPTAHPEGHSYQPPGEKHLPPRLCQPHEWKGSEDYLFGIDLYNHAYWWEAHEVWEGIWQQTQKGGIQGQFLQGIIQVSACHLKLCMGNLRGVLELLKKSSEHLGVVLAHVGDETYMGLPLADWHSQVWDYYDAILSREPRDLSHQLKQYPYIQLIGKR